MSSLKRGGNNLALFTKTVVAGVIGIFSIFVGIVSWNSDILFTLDVPHSRVIIFSWAIAIATIIYFFSRWKNISTEYLDLHIRYLKCIDTYSSWKRFFASIPLNGFTSAIQFGMIWTMEVFRPEVPPEWVTGTTFLIVSVLNFFILRIFLFNYRHDNYAWQGISYTLITLGTVGFNMLLVWYLTSFNFWPILPLVEFIVRKLGPAMTAQIIFSLTIGALPYKAHEKITFKKNGIRHEPKSRVQ